MPPEEAGSEQQPANIEIDIENAQNEAEAGAARDIDTFVAD